MLQDSPGGGPAVTQSQIDAAKAAMDAAERPARGRRTGAGARHGRPAQGGHRAGGGAAKAPQAQLALLKQQLDDAT